MNSDIPAHDRATRHYLGLLGVWIERQARKAEADAPAPTRRADWSPATPPCSSAISAAAWAWPTMPGRWASRPRTSRAAATAALAAPRQRPSPGPPHLRGAQASGRDAHPGGAHRRGSRVQLGGLFHPGLPAPDRQVADGLPPRALIRTPCPRPFTPPVPPGDSRLQPVTTLCAAPAAVAPPWPGHRPFAKPDVGFRTQRVPDDH